MIPTLGELDALLGFTILLMLFMVASDVVDDLRWFARQGHRLAELLRRRYRRAYVAVK